MKSEEMGEHAPADTEDVAGGVSDPLAGLKARVDRHPYGALAAALGVGYALGGGIFTPLTSRLVRLGVRIGWRAALLPLVTKQIAELVEGVFDPEKPKVDGASARQEGAAGEE